MGLGLGLWDIDPYPFPEASNKVVKLLTLLQTKNHIMKAQATVSWNGNNNIKKKW